MSTTIIISDDSEEEALKPASLVNASQDKAAAKGKSRQPPPPRPQSPLKGRLDHPNGVRSFYTTYASIGKTEPSFFANSGAKPAASSYLNAARIENDHHVQLRKKFPSSNSPRRPSGRPPTSTPSQYESLDRKSYKPIEVVDLTVDELPLRDSPAPPRSTSSISKSLPSLSARQDEIPSSPRRDSSSSANTVFPQASSTPPEPPEKGQKPEPEVSNPLRDDGFSIYHDRESLAGKPVDAPSPRPSDDITGPRLQQAIYDIRNPGQPVLRDRPEHVLLSDDKTMTQTPKNTTGNTMEKSIIKVRNLVEPQASESPKIIQRLKLNGPKPVRLSLNSSAVAHHRSPDQSLNSTDKTSTQLSSVAQLALEDIKRRRALSSQQFLKGHAEKMDSDSDDADARLKRSINQASAMYPRFENAASRKKRVVPWRKDEPTKNPEKPLMPQNSLSAKRDNPRPNKLPHDAGGKTPNGHSTASSQGPINEGAKESTPREATVHSKSRVFKGDHVQKKIESKAKEAIRSPAYKRQALKEDRISQKVETKGAALVPGAQKLASTDNRVISETGPKGATPIPEPQRPSSIDVEAPALPMPPINNSNSAADKQTSKYSLRSERTQSEDIAPIKTKSIDPDAKILEAILKPLAFEMRTDQEYLVAAMLFRARKDAIDCSPPASNQSMQDPFSAVVKSRRDQFPQKSLRARIEIRAASARNVKIPVEVQVVSFDCGKAPMPTYNSIVRLNSNVLAENDKEMRYLPYFPAEEEKSHDEDSKEARRAELEEGYNNRTKSLPYERKCAEQAEFWRECTEYFLEGIGCTSIDVMYYLLHDEDSQWKPNCSMSSEALEQWLARENCCSACHTRYEGARWDRLAEHLSDHHRPTEQVLAIAGLACSVFSKITKFSIWHVVSTDAKVMSLLQELQSTCRPGRRSEGEPNQSLCSLCHIFDCPNHGAYIEDKDHGSDTESNSDTDADIRQHVSLPTVPWNERPINKTKRVPSQRGIPNTTNQDKDRAYWLAMDAHDHEQRKPFVPCSHFGLCHGNPECSCWANKVPCERICGCDKTCSHRFRGCKCIARGTKICFKDDRCDCFALNRECDPWLCGQCGVLEVLDPVNRYDDEILRGRCQNAMMQRGVPKRTLKGPSEVHGWGLFSAVHIRPNEFIGEYKGEIISEQESCRRGLIYHYRGIEYLFRLNKEQEIDSSRSGNKMRFINNSERGSTINVQAKTMFCNTVSRIGLYAKRSIAAGEEMFFRYGYPPEITKNFWEKEDINPISAAHLSKGLDEDVIEPAVQQRVIAVKQKSQKLKQKEDQDALQYVGDKDQKLESEIQSQIDPSPSKSKKRKRSPIDETVYDFNSSSPIMNHTVFRNKRSRKDTEVDALPETEVATVDLPDAANPELIVLPDYETEDYEDDDEDADGSSEDSSAYASQCDPNDLAGEDDDDDEEDDDLPILSARSRKDTKAISSTSRGSSSRKSNPTRPTKASKPRVSQQQKKTTTIDDERLQQIAKLDLAVEDHRSKQASARAAQDQETAPKPPGPPNITKQAKATEPIPQKPELIPASSSTANPISAPRKTYHADPIKNEKIHQIIARTSDPSYNNRSRLMPHEMVARTGQGEDAFRRWREAEMVKKAHSAEMARKKAARAAEREDSYRRWTEAEVAKKKKPAKTPHEMAARAKQADWSFRRWIEAEEVKKARSIERRVERELINVNEDEAVGR